MGRLSSSSIVLFVALSSCYAGSRRIPTEHTSAAVHASPPPPPGRSRSADAILERNPFDSTTGPLERDASGAAALDGPTCRDIDLRRVILSVNPDWTFAEVSDDKLPVMLHLGSSLHGRHLASIEADRIWMAGAGGPCHADLGGKSLVSSKECVASRFPLGPPCIARRADGSFEIARTMMDHVLEAQAELMRSARIVPESDGQGKVIGIRLFGVRPDSLLGALGFENGDTLVTVNDLDITTPEHALEAYAGLRSKTELRVGLRRRGQQVVLRYHLR